MIERSRLSGKAVLPDTFSLRSIEPLVVMRESLQLISLVFLGFFALTSPAKAESWEDYVEFRDEIKPRTVPEIYVHQGKIKIVVWNDEDKASLSSDIETVFGNARGIFRLGSSQGPVPLYRLTGGTNSYGGHGALWLNYLGVNVVAHELTHVADAEHKIARSEEFRLLVEPRIKKLRELMNENGISDLASKEANERLDIADQCGLPNAYSAETIQETLAELARNIVIGKDAKLPPELKHFVSKNLINATLAPDPSIPLHRDGKIARLRGDIEVAYEKLNGAVKADPEFAEAYIERGLLHELDRKHELARDDFSTALSLMSEYDWHTYKVYQFRAQQYAALAQNEEALADFEAAGRIKPNDLTIKKAIVQFKALVEMQKKFKK